MCDDAQKFINGLGIGAYEAYMSVVMDMVSDDRISAYVRQEYMQKLIDALANKEARK